jgi:hypothetical protein
VFASIPEPLDLKRDRETLLRAVAAERDQQRAAPLSHDEAMSALCTQTAQRYFSQPKGTDRALLEALSQTASKTRPPYSRLAAVMTVVSSIQQAATLQALLDPKARAVGIGLAQGTRADTVDDAIVVVLLLGY